MADSNGSSSGKSPSKTIKDYLDLSRWESVNHYKTEAKKLPGHKLSDFLTSTVWSWLYHYIKSRFGPKNPYLSYSNEDTGIYTISSQKELTIAIASDWATDTPNSFEIADAIRDHDATYTIHVGDTYYVGAPHEIASNFTDEGSPWPRGREGSFAVLGNHEMYARGVSFFRDLLKTLGTKGAKGGYAGQKAGYFCLENNYWRILGLDTGYNSVGKPIIEFLPFMSPDCHFEDELMKWLKETVKLGDPSDKRGLIILTHHQFISAFEKESEYQKPFKQLSSLFTVQRDIIWLWGHEHKLSFFEKASADTQLSVHGRCIGHGGMPIELKFVLDNGKKGYSKLVAFDARVKDDKLKLGYNGYALLKMNAMELKIEYYDNAGLLLTETWTADITNGTTRGDINVINAELTMLPGKNWEDIVRK